MSSQAEHEARLKRVLEALPEELKAELSRLLSCPLCRAGLQAGLKGEPPPPRKPLLRPKFDRPRITEAELDELRIL